MHSHFIGFVTRRLIFSGFPSGCCLEAVYIMHKSFLDMARNGKREQSVEQIRRAFDDNGRIIFVSSP